MKGWPLFCILMILVVVVWPLFYQDANSKTAEQKLIDPADRFYIEHVELDDMMIIKIIYDRKTTVRYLYVGDGRGAAGLCHLLSSKAFRSQ